MPLLDPNHLSPTGQRITPPIEATVYRPPAHVSASQLNADIADYLRELEELRKLVMLKVMGETND